MKQILIMITLCFIIFITGCSSKDNLNEPKFEEIDSNQGLALINANIIDGTGRDPIENGVILIKNGLIEKIGNKQDINVPSSYLIKDMKNKTVMPGFINAHVHGVYDEVILNKFLKAGITTVRALSNSGYSNFIERKNGLNNNSYNSFIIQSSPIISVTGGYGSVFFNSKEEAINIVNDYIDKCVDIVKFSIENFCQGRTWIVMNEESVEAIVQTAHQNNKRVAVHITWERNLEIAIAAGVDEISHMVVDYISQDTVDAMIEKDIYWVPTLELWRGISKSLYLTYDNAAISNLNLFYKAGGKVAMGTDFRGYTTPFDEGFPITEILMMKEAEMTNMDIIVACTKNAAIVCDRADEIGTLEVGKKADIFVVKGNPLEDINVFLKPHLVIHHGKLIIQY